MAPFSDWPHQWFWDGHEHVDPAKEASAQATRLANHTTTLAHEYARHQQCLNHLLRRCHDLEEAATGGGARFPRRVRELLQAGLELRDRHAAGQVSDHGLAVAQGRLPNALAEAVFPSKTHEANDRFPQHRGTISRTCLPSSTSQAWMPLTGGQSWRFASG